MDQGIIASFKLGYRRQWILYMLQQYEAGKDPNKTVNLLKAVQWTRIAWEQVTAQTIQRCWWKSTVIKKPGDVQVAMEYQHIDELQAQIARLPINDPLPLDEFLAPTGEAN